jgi:23S rRNA (uracil1939-C5)-methyltransferase
MTASSNVASLRPEKFIPGGEALAHAPDGRVVFIRGAIPGEEVGVEVFQEKRDWSRAAVTDIHVPSPNRVEPPCPQRRLGCGGCDWQHLDPAIQLSAKTEIVRSTLERTARLENPEVREGRSVSPFGYRTSLRVVGDDESRASFRKERSHETVSSQECLVAYEPLRSLLSTIKIDPGLEVSVRMSVATKEMTIHWDTRQGTVLDVPADVGVGREAVLYEGVSGHRLRVSSGSFFQSGPEAAELLLEALADASAELNDASSVVDAYAGVGLFAVAATNPDTRVIAIESSRWSTADCVVNLDDRDASVERVRVEQWVADEPVDVVIADPSRSGLERRGANALATAKAPVLLLVSCDPTALARDTTLLAVLGYRHDGTEVLDLFPNTHHVECVTRFVKS